jgi:conjugal transfer mating pair stabilization protein TraG
MLHYKRIILTVIAFFISPTLLLSADNADIIWTWGNGAFIASMFSWIYFILNIDTLQPIIKYAALIGVIIVAVREFAGSKGGEVDPRGMMWKLLMFFIMTQLIVSLFLTVKQDATHRVYIISANELSAPAWETCRPVGGDNNCYAPIGIKYLMSAATNFEKATVAMMEEAMYDASTLSFSFARMGLGFPFTFHQNLSEHIPMSSHQYQTFMEFYENCIIYDLVDGGLSVDELYQSDQLHSTVLSNNNRFTTVYNTTHPTGIVKGCWQVTETDLLGNGLTCANYAQNKLIGSMTGTPAAEATAGDICDAILDYAGFAYKHSHDVDSMIKHRITMNLMNDAIVNSALMSGLSPTDIAYGSAMAEREQRSKWLVMGIMAKEWIPKLRGVMQAFAIGIIWVLAILTIASGSLRYLNYALGFQVALIVWSILLVIINYQSIVTMGEMLPNIFLGELGAGQGQLTLLSQPTMDEENAKVMAYLGYLSVAAFMMAMGIAGVSARALGAMGMGLGQLVAGSRVTDGMTTGQQNFGLTQSRADGVTSWNQASNMRDVITSPGSRESSNLSGVNSTTTTDSLGNTVAEKNVDGKSLTEATTTGGSSAGVTSDGNVVGAKPAAGVAGNINKIMQNSAAHSLVQATQKLDAVEENLSNARASNEQTAEKVLHGATKDLGTGAQKVVDDTKQRAVSNALEEMYRNGEITREQYDEARNRYDGLEAGAKLSGGVGFELFGNSSKLEAYGSAKTGYEDSTKDSKSEISSLESSFADKYNRELSQSAREVLQNSETLTASEKEGYSNELNKSWAEVEQQQSAYKEATARVQSAQENLSRIESDSGAVSQEVYGAYLQHIYDTQGFDQMKAEMVRLEDRGYATQEFDNFIRNYSPVGDGSGLKSEVDTRMNEADNAIASGKEEIKPPTKSVDFENAKDYAATQAKLWQNDVRRKYADDMANRGDTELVQTGVDAAGTPIYGLPETDSLREPTPREGSTNPAGSPVAKVSDESTPPKTPESLPESPKSPTNQTSFNATSGASRNLSNWTKKGG